MNREQNKTVKNARCIRDLKLLAWKVEDIQAFCEKNNIKLSIVQEETSQYASGKIIRQSRTGRIISGATLKVVVAKEVSLPAEINPAPPADDSNNTDDNN